MNTTVKVLEKLLAKRQENVLRYDADSRAHNELVNECTALVEAIAWAKVGEWLRNCNGNGVAYLWNDGDDWIVDHTPVDESGEQHQYTAPTITELAEKLK